MTGTAYLASAMRSEGTDPVRSIEIADVVSEVWRAWYADETAWVPFSFRYAIAHEVQRRLAALDKEKTG